MYYCSLVDPGYVDMKCDVVRVPQVNKDGCSSSRPRGDMSNSLAGGCHSVVAGMKLVFPDDDYAPKRVFTLVPSGVRTP